MNALLIFLAISSPPQFVPSDAARAVRNNYGGYTYYNRNNQFSGRSYQNNFGGHSYYNNRGLYGRSYNTTPNTYRFNKGYLR